MRSFQSLLLLILLLGCSKSSDSDTDSTPNTPPQPKRYSLTVSVTPSEGGVVSPSSGTFEEGTVVKIEGIPSNGYLFKEWSGDVQGTDNSISVTMDSNKSITGTFEKTPEFSYKESIIELRNQVLDVIVQDLPSWYYSFDLENDGDLDLIVIQSGPNGSPKKEMILFKNQDNKGFEEIPTGIDCWGRNVVFDDFNGDGLIDFFVPDHGFDQPPFPGGQDQMIFQTPNGGLEEVTEQVLPIGSNFSHGGCSIDLENDGDKDIIVNTGGSQLVLRNQNGIFELWENSIEPSINNGDYNLPNYITIDGEIRPEYYPVYISGWWSESGDFNNDGYEDSIIGCSMTYFDTPPDENGFIGLTLDPYGNILDKSDLILLQEPVSGKLVYDHPNSLIPTSWRNLGIGGVTIGIQVNDFNDDGCLDLVTYSSNYNNSHRLDVNYGNCDGTFDLVSTFELPISETNDTLWGNFELVDIDNDGDLDVVISNTIEWVSTHLIPEEHVVLENESGVLNYRLGSPEDLINLPPNIGISWYLDGE